MLALTAVAAFGHVFSFLAFWDDEGFFMLTARHFLDGYPLYGEVYTAYGPLYYAYKWLLHEVAGLPLTHDVVRLNTVTIWVLACAACFATVLRLTRNLPLAVLAQLAIFFHLRCLKNEPGHPHELGTFLIALVPLAAAAFDRRRWLAGALIGVLVGGAVTLKVNVGILAGAGAWVPLLATTRGNKAATALSLITAAAAFATPWVLMNPHLDNRSVQAYAVTSSVAILATTVLALSRGDRTGTFKHGALFLASLFLMVIGACIFPIAHGTTLQGLWHCLVVLPSRFPFFFSLPASAGPYTFTIPAIAAVAALLVAPDHSFWRSTARSAGLRELLLVGGKVGFALSVFGMSAATATGGLIAYAAPFLWIAVVPLRTAPADAVGNATAAGGSINPSGRLSLGRIALVMQAAFQTLQAYPVSGSQRHFATFLMVAVAAVVTSDVLDWCRSHLSHRPVSVARSAYPRAAAAAVIVLVFATAAAGMHRIRHYWAQVPLSMPGATLLRVDPEQAAVYQALVEALKDKDAFFATTGTNSLYFWTGTRPTTRLVLTHEVRQFPEARLRAMVDTLLECKNPCVVARGPTLWEQPYHPPLHGRIDQHFIAGPRIGTYVLMVPKRNTAPAASQPAAVAGEAIEVAPGRTATDSRAPRATGVR